jgi:hypothetical protein
MNEKDAGESADAAILLHKGRQKGAAGNLKETWPMGSLFVVRQPTS